MSGHSHRYSTYELDVLRRRGSLMGSGKGSSSSGHSRTATTGGGSKGRGAVGRSYSMMQVGHSKSPSLFGSSSARARGFMSPPRSPVRSGGGFGYMVPASMAIPRDAAMDSEGTAERDMMSALMTAMVSGQGTQVSDRERKVFSMLEEARVEADALEEDFAEVKDAMTWTRIEVCDWLCRERLSEYCFKFHSNSVDGSIVILDLVPEMLQRDLRVAPIHIPKMMRAIASLREAYAKETEAKKKAEEEGAEFESVERLKRKIEKLTIENGELKKQILELKGGAAAVLADSKAEIISDESTAQT